MHKSPERDQGSLSISEQAWGPQMLLTAPPCYKVYVWAEEVGPEPSGYKAAAHLWKDLMTSAVNF